MLCKVIKKHQKTQEERKLFLSIFLCIPFYLKELNWFRTWTQHKALFSIKIAYENDVFSDSGYSEKKKYKFRQQGIIAATDALPLNYDEICGKKILLGYCFLIFMITLFFFLLFQSIPQVTCKTEIRRWLIFHFFTGTALGTCPFSLDQVRFLGNYPPSPPLSHQFVLSEK